MIPKTAEIISNTTLNSKSMPRSWATNWILIVSAVVFAAAYNPNSAGNNALNDLVLLQTVAQLATQNHDVPCQTGINEND